MSWRLDGDEVKTLFTSKRLRGREGVAQSAHVLGALFALLFSACAGEGLTCGEDTQLDDGYCVPAEGAQASEGASTTDSATGSESSTEQSEPTEPPVVEIPDEAIGNCPKGLPGPVMVEVNGPSGPLCVDSTEVTQAQYAEFLQSSPQMDEDVDICGANSTFLPEGEGTDQAYGCPLAQPFDPVSKGSEPVVCIDWCDANAYCKWSGKRLCGGPQGERLLAENVQFAADYAAVADAQTELRYVCTNGGTRNFPYGSTFDPTRCTSDRVGPVGTCEGPSSVFDLVGNVAEWTALCSSSVPSLEVHCVAVGGSSRSGLYAGYPEDGCLQSRAALAWQSPLGNEGYGFSDVGVRCCADIP